MKTLIISAVFCLAVQLASAAPSDKVDCSKMDEILDDLGGAQGITSLNEKYKMSTTMDELMARCNEMSDAIKTLRRYNKECYTSLTQQVFSAILRTRSEMNEAHCKPDSQEAKNAYEATKCISDNAMDQIKDAEKKTILSSQVLYDANIADPKLRLRRSCCSVLASKTFFLNATKDKCPQHQKVYSDYVDSYTSEAMGLICPEESKLECDKLEPLKLEGVETRSKFFLNPMLKLVKTLDLS